MRYLLLVALLAVNGCATLRNDKTVCAEYRGMHCASAPECSMDMARGCQVCQCQPGVTTDGRLPTGIAPDRRQ